MALAALSLDQAGEEGVDPVKSFNRGETETLLWNFPHKTQIDLLMEDFLRGVLQNLHEFGERLGVDSRVAAIRIEAGAYLWLRFQLNDSK